MGWWGGRRAERPPGATVEQALEQMHDWLQEHERVTELLRTEAARRKEHHADDEPPSGRTRP